MPSPRASGSCTCAGRSRSIGLGLATGLAVSLKISAPAYLLPLFVLLFFKQRLSGALAAAAIALVVALLPFVSREISLANYIEYLQLSAGNGLRRRQAAPERASGCFFSPRRLAPR